MPNLDTGLQKTGELGRRGHWNRDAERKRKYDGQKVGKGRKRSRTLVPSDEEG